MVVRLEPRPSATSPAERHAAEDVARIAQEDVLQAGPVAGGSRGPLPFGGLRTLCAAYDTWSGVRRGEAEIGVRQRRRLERLIAHARRRSALYADLYADVGGSPVNLGALPPVTKQLLMARFDEWVTDPALTRANVAAFVAEPGSVGDLLLNQYAVWTSSGTTGEPGMFVHDQAAQTVYTALAVVRGWMAWVGLKRFGGVARRGLRVAVVVATGGRFFAVSLAERHRRANPWFRRVSRCFSLWLPIEKLVPQLNAYQPTVLCAYPTALTLLASEQHDGHLRIAPLLIVTAAEWLPQATRASLAAAFHCPVRDAYGASECGPIAFECEHGWLHANADWVIAEPVTEDYQPVPPGHMSYSTLITNLANCAQPLIRYDLGDSVLVRPDSCPCGSPLPALRVQGRTADLLSFPASGGRTIQVPPLALTSQVIETPGVRRFQLVQTNSRTLSVRLETVAGTDGEAVWRDFSGRLQGYLAQQGLSSIRLARSSEPPARDRSSGKFRQVSSALPRPASP